MPPLTPTPAKGSFRDDPRWRQAQADFVSDAQGLSPTEALVRRLRAANRMFEIECEFERSSKVSQ